MENAKNQIGGKDAEKYAKELAHELYYDLLDKYTYLLQQHKILQSMHKQKSLQILEYKIHNASEYSEIVQNHKKIITIVLGILHSNYTNMPRAIKKVEELKQLHERIDGPKIND